MSESLSLKKSSSLHVAFITVECDDILREKIDVSFKNNVRDDTIHKESRGSSDSEKHEMITMTVFKSLNFVTMQLKHKRIKYNIVQYVNSTASEHIIMNLYIRAFIRKKEICLRC